MTARYRLHSPGYPEEIDFLRSEFDQRGWTETDGDDWDFMWSFDFHGDRVFRSVRADQRINHYPGVATLHYKDELAFFLKRTAERVGVGEGLYDFVPETFLMPSQYDEWRARAAANPDRIWILKPTRLTGGRGIRLITDVDDVERGRGWIVQQYIADPLLLPGHPYKHVMRIYVLVTSLDPLVAYLHPNGPIKFTTRPFGTSAAELGDRVRHVTNPTVQLSNEDVDDPVRILDWPEYRIRLGEAGHDADVLWSRIRLAVTQTLIAHRDPMLRLSRYQCGNVDACYELLGYDITVDAALRPWVLECNMSPSLSIRGSQGSVHRSAHERAKHPMIADTLTLLGVNESGSSPNTFATEYGPIEFGAERTRRGQFEVLYPADDAPRFEPCFETLTSADRELLEVAGAPGEVLGGRWQLGSDFSPDFGHEAGTADQP